MLKAFFRSSTFRLMREYFLVFGNCAINKSSNQNLVPMNLIIIISSCEWSRIKIRIFGLLVNNSDRYFYNHDVAKQFHYFFDLMYIRDNCRRDSQFRFFSNGRSNLIIISLWFTRWFFTYTVDIFLFFVFFSSVISNYKWITIQCCCWIWWENLNNIQFFDCAIY